MKLIYIEKDFVMGDETIDGGLTLFIENKPIHVSIRNTTITNGQFNIVTIFHKDERNLWQRMTNKPMEKKYTLQYDIVVIGEQSHAINALLKPSGLIGSSIHFERIIIDDSAPKVGISIK